MFGARWGIWTIRQVQLMRLLARFLLGFIKLLSGGDVRMNGATVESAPLRIEVEGGPRRVCLVQARLDGSGYHEPAPDEMICLDVHESHEALSYAVKFVRQAFSFEPGSEITYLPTIFALVNVRSLTPGELWVVNKQLIPSGATLFPYPKGCTSFAQAMRVLSGEIAKYRESHGGRLEVAGFATATSTAVASPSAASTATSTGYSSAAAGAASAEG